MITVNIVMTGRDYSSTLDCDYHTSTRTSDVACQATQTYVVLNANLLRLLKVRNGEVGGRFQVVQTEVLAVVVVKNCSYP